MNNTIKNISEIAKTLADSDARMDQDVCKMTILFPLIEALGYDATRTGDILLNPAYTGDGLYKLDYGLRGEAEETLKTAIKMIDYDAEPGLEFSKIRQALATIEHTSYVIITDCFNYYIYSNADDDSTFFEVASFNICNLSNEHIRTLTLLSNPVSNIRQDFAVDDQYDLESDACETTDMTKYEKGNLRRSRSEAHNRKSFSPWILPVVFASICLCMLVTSALMALYHRTDPNYWYKVSFPHNSYELDYHTLSGSISASAYPDRLSEIRVMLRSSNLPEGVNVYFDLKNETRNETVEEMIMTDSKGEIDVNISLPSSWIDCNIDVSAKLIFDENQTAIAKDKYGTGGSKIIQIGDVDKLLIGEDSVFYNHSQIQQHIKEKEEQEAAARLQAAKDYFRGYTIIKYSNGDMCFYPKGYDTDDWPSNSDATNTNITSNNKAYAKIYYHADTNTADFYFVIGTLMKSAHFWSAGGSFVLSNTVQTYSLSTKSGNFYQHVNPMTSITGWCVFTQTGVGNLLPMLKSIYASNVATVEFKGLNEKVYVSQADKKAVMSIIDLYDKYFSSGNINLDPRWFTD